MIDAPGGSTRERADRRQLTVLFCDVAGSTRLVEDVGEEEWSYALREYHVGCQRIIERFDGHIAQYLGDGLLAYFGYPAAHENNAQRAIKAALEILAQLDEINARARAASGRPQLAFRLRIAVHTGVVIVDEPRAGSTEHIALGIVPAVAARLQEQAGDNTVVISDATHRLVRGEFLCRSLGSFRLRGVSAVQPAWQVTGESDLQSRFDVAVSRGLTPFVGRTAELDELAQAWRETGGRRGRVLIVEGEPGIGKSRLVREFMSALDRGSAALIECRCSPYHRNSAYHPIIALLHALLGVEAADRDDLKLERIERAAQRMEAPGEAALLLARLLSVSVRDRESAAPPAQERQRLHALLIDWLRREADERPALLFIEDVHWADPSTLELLEGLAGCIADTRILLILTLRPQIGASWAPAACTVRLSLGPLSRESAQRMVSSLGRGRAFEAAVERRLIEQSDGVPLFIEESALHALSQEEIEDASSIPASLQDLLMARLDGLGRAKEIAQAAATIGHDFSRELLLATEAADENTIDADLTTLTASGLVRPLNSPGCYAFKHALVRDAAYHSLLVRTRRALHERIARAYCERFVEIARSQPELVAHHYTEAGLAQNAVDYWQNAGLRSAERFALAEAIEHLRRALELLATLPTTRDRLRQELECLAMLAGRLLATQGYGAAGVETLYERALELARGLGEDSRTLKMLLGLESVHFMRANFSTAHRLAQEALTLAATLEDPARLGVVEWALGEIDFHRGEFAECERRLTTCVANYQRSHHRARTLQDPAVMSLSYGAWAKWTLGYPERALTTVRRAVELAEELAHPFSRAVAYSFAAGLHLFRGEIEAAETAAGQAISICTEHGFPVWLAYSTVVRGRAAVERGEVQAGVADMEQGLAVWRGSGALVTVPYFCSLLAEGFAAAGEPLLALRNLDAAQSIVDRTGERYYESEILRLRGESLVQAYGQQDVRAPECFLRAREIARRQSARSFELRAQMSLTRLVQGADGGVASRRALGEIYQWFAEGADTRDLRSARRLLSDFES